MYALKFDYALTQHFRGLVVEYIPVKGRDGKMKHRWVLGIAAAFEIKDELKEFCDERGGTWYPLHKYWWVPLQKPKDQPKSPDTFAKMVWKAAKEVIDRFGSSIKMGSQIYLAIEDYPKFEDFNEDVEDFLKIKLESLTAIANEQLRLEKEWAELPQLFNKIWVSDVDDENPHECRGDEGHWEADCRLSNGKIQKVVVFGEEPPKDLEEFNRQCEEVGGGEYRQYKDEEGKLQWCKPAFRMDCFDFGLWDDFVPEPRTVKIPEIALDEIVDRVPEPKVEIVEPDVKIALAISKKTREPLYFMVSLHSDLAFRSFLGRIRNLPQREWKQEKKIWEVSLDCTEKLKELILDYQKPSSITSSLKFEISNGASTILYPQEVRK